MYYFLPHKLALLMLIILLGSSSIALKGEGYSNAITKENIFTSKNILPVDKAFQLDIKIHDRKILLEWKIDEEGAPVFDFWLHKGTYATSFLREIMKSEDVTVY